jgi:hypothetical protein
VRPGRQALFLGAVEPPGRADLWPAMGSKGLRKYPDLIGMSGFIMHPQAGSPRAPVWCIILGHALLPLPHPAARIAPAAYGCCGPRAPVCGLECHSERGSTPPRAAPAIGPWGF